MLLRYIDMSIGCPTADYYGANCSLPCPDRCNNSRCHIETGHCFECKDGFQGPMCELRTYYYVLIQQHLNLRFLF